MSIKDIPTATFNAIVEELLADGWQTTDEYDGFDAWIDYGLLRMTRTGVDLKLEWDNWFEGVIEGPDEIVAAIRDRYQLK